MRDLNELKAPGYSAHLEQGKDINDRRNHRGRAVDLETGVRTAFRAVRKRKSTERKDALLATS